MFTELSQVLYEVDGTFGAPTEPPSICTSAFVNALWTTSLYGYGSTVNSYVQVDRPLLSKQHQLMGWLCSEFKIIVDYLLNKHQLSFGACSLSSPELSAGALVPTVFNTDWSLEYGNVSNNYFLRSVPREFSNGTCNCVVSDAYYESMRIGPPELVLPGLIVGCWPIYGLRMSTLECFFSSSCIYTIINYLDYFTQMDGSPPANFTLPNVPSLAIDPLNSSITSRFTPNTTIGMLI
ncbi:hypothetical protein I4U23_016753 [Adineta vaga]|nr:hypothetical protein I4U23_016753 [Adineta vaga]